MFCLSTVFNLPSLPALCFNHCFCLPSVSAYFLCLPVRCFDLHFLSAYFFSFFFFSISMSTVSAYPLCLPSVSTCFFCLPVQTCSGTASKRRWRSWKRARTWSCTWTGTATRRRSTMWAASTPASTCASLSATRARPSSTSLSPSKVCFPPNLFCGAGERGEGGSTFFLFLFVCWGGGC